MTADSARFVIPARRDWLALPFLTLWVLVCAAAVVFPILVAVPALGAVPPAFALTFLPWLGAWAVVGGVSLHAWLWMLTGREVVTASAAVLTVRRQVAGLGRARQYAVSAIRDVRIIPWTAPPSFWASRQGSILFDYGSDTVRFGVGLTGTEARQLVQALREVAPTLGSAPAEAADAD
jgi:hypothetical protein